MLNVTLEINLICIYLYDACHVYASFWHSGGNLELSPRSASLRFFALYFSVMVPSEIVTLLLFLLLTWVTVNVRIHNQSNFALLTKFLIKTVSNSKGATSGFGLISCQASAFRCLADVLSNLIQTLDERSLEGV